MLYVYYYISVCFASSSYVEHLQSQEFQSRTFSDPYALEK